MISRDVHESTILRIVQMVRAGNVHFEVDFDGVCAAFNDNPALVKPVPGVVAGLNALREVADVELLTGRNATFLAAHLPVWGLLGLSARPTYATQTLTWHGNNAVIEGSHEAEEGEARIERFIPVLFNALGFTPPFETKSHLINIPLMNLSAADRNAVSTAFDSSAVSRAIEELGLKVVWHQSGSVEVQSIQANKVHVVEPGQKYVFCCDDTGDIDLAQYIHNNDAGVVIGVDNPPDSSGRPGTPQEILDAADFVITGDRETLPQTRFGEFLSDLAARLRGE